MMGIDDLVAAISTLQRSDLERWIGEELVVPRQDAGSLAFSEVECARVRLIYTLTYELEIDSGTLPVVLSLLDQLYDTRQRLLSLTQAVAAQDLPIQAAIPSRPCRPVAICPGTENPRCISGKPRLTPAPGS